MKILHLLFDDYPFINEWGYQENKMCNVEVRNADVVVITGLYKTKILKEYVELNKLKKYEEYEKYGHLLKVYRLNCWLGSTPLGAKIKLYRGLKKVLCKENPDYIFVHDLHALSLLTLSRYLKNNSKVICFADVHVNYANSATNRFSRIMHKTFYKAIIQQCKRRIKCIYYLNQNSKQFINDMYSINESNTLIDFLPLGGEIMDYSEKERIHFAFCKKEKIDTDSIIFVHSGKLNSKKKTIETLDAFSRINNKKIILYIVGLPEQEISKQFFNAVNADQRIKYIGWKSNSELMDLLKAADCYLQPGTPSVTAHEALCKGCATLLSAEGDFYKDFISDDSAYYIDSVADIEKFIKEMSESPQIMKEFQLKGNTVAKRIFDYESQSRRLFWNDV